MPGWGSYSYAASGGIVSPPTTPKSSQYIALRAEEVQLVDNSVDEAAAHSADGEPPHQGGEHQQRPYVAQIRQGVEAEHGVPDQLHAVVQRVDVGDRLGPSGQAVDREERARDQEQRRQDAADDVVETVDRGHHRRRPDAEEREADRREDREQRDRDHARSRSQAEGEGDEDVRAGV